MPVASRSTSDRAPKTGTASFRNGFRPPALVETAIDLPSVDDRRMPPSRCGISTLAKRCCATPIAFGVAGGADDRCPSAITLPVLVVTVWRSGRGLPSVTVSSRRTTMRFAVSTPWRKGFRKEERASSARTAVLLGNFRIGRDMTRLSINNQQQHTDVCRISTNVCASPLRCSAQKSGQFTPSRRGTVPGRWPFDVVTTSWNACRPVHHSRTHRLLLLPGHGHLSQTKGERLRNEASDSSACPKVQVELID